MKPAKHFLPAAVFLTVFALSAKSQKQPVKYTDFDRGYRFFYYKKWDSAFLMFNRYISNADDTLNKAKAYSFMGEMQWKTGNLYDAQQSLLDAIKVLDPENEKHREEIGFTNNILGNVSLELKQYEGAIQFYDKAIPVFRGKEYLFEVMNGKATAFQKNGNYNKAVALYDSMLALKPADQKLFARIIDNRARTKWLQNPGYPALPEFRTALKIRKDSQHIAVPTVSYAHISDYYANINPDSAIWYAQKMRASATANNNPDDILEAIDKMVRLTSSPLLKEQWYAEYRLLNDSLQFSRDTTRNRYALINYDFQKTKADNLELQQHVSKQRLLLYGLIAVAVAIIAGLWTWYNKRRKRIKQESENAIRNARLKTSQKVHDVVANGLYGIMNELEHRTSIDREPLINKIEDLYEKSRNISYEEMPAAIAVDYNNQAHNLLNAYSTGETRVIIVGNQPEFWNRITGAQRNELELVLQELMINMQKHSKAKNVSVVFRQENNRAFITYKDDGRGFPPGSKFGNGLNNTVSRIKSMNGEVNFGKSEKEGLSVAVSFPLESGNI